MPAPALITLDNVRVAHGRRVALSVESWAWRAGEHWALLGGNGSGKSTFLRLLRGDLAPVPDGRGQRWYHLDGQPGRFPGELKERLILVSPEQQERYLRTEWRLRGRDVVASGIHQTDYLQETVTRDQWNTVRDLLARLGLESLGARDVQELSQGELRRLLLARAWMARPRLLMLDEITDGLDARSRQQMLELIESTARQGIPVIHATHRPDELVPAITHVLELAGGVIKNSRERSQSTVLPGATPARRRRPVADSPAPAAPAIPAAEPVVTFENCSVHLGGRRVLGPLSWSLQPGEHWAVTGPNGAGKSTFLRLVAGDLHPAIGGRVRRAGNPVTLWEIREHLGLVSAALQTDYHGEALEKLTVKDAVASGLQSRIGFPDPLNAAGRRRVREVLGEFELTGLARRNFMELSYGQRRRVLLARSIVHRPRLLLLDEPFDGLDIAGREFMQDRLESLARAGTQLLVITHHPEDLPRCLTHELQLARGRISAQGPRS